MNASVEKVLSEALGLSAVDRASVAESLLHSLDKPDSKIDQVWAEEVEARVNAADRGEIEMVLVDEVFSKYGKD